MEDTTFTVKISFNQLEYVEPDAYFTENCVVLAQGHYSNELFMLHRVMHPPLLADKGIRFKIYEQDYFGSYIKMSEQFESIFKNQHDEKQAAALKVMQTLVSLDPGLVVINQPDLDIGKSVQALKTMLIGLDGMRPEVIVMIGNFVSPTNRELQTFDKIKSYFDEIVNIIKENELHCLRDLTQWIFMPSIGDPGIMKVMPTFKISDFLVSGIKGIGPNRLKKVMLGTNPMRLSFRGKEIVFSRYDYFKKLKKNNIEQLMKKQEAQSEEQEQFKIVKTVLHQGSLMPLAPII
jgi:hypothetical protein